MKTFLKVQMAALAFAGLSHAAGNGGAYGGADFKTAAAPIETEQGFTDQNFKEAYSQCLFGDGEQDRPGNLKSATGIVPTFLSKLYKQKVYVDIASEVTADWIPIRWSSYELKRASTRLSCSGPVVDSIKTLHFSCAPLHDDGSIGLLTFNLRGISPKKEVYLFTNLPAIKASQFRDGKKYDEWGNYIGGGRISLGISIVEPDMENRKVGTIFNGETYVATKVTFPYEELKSCLQAELSKMSKP